VLHSETAVQAVRRKIHEELGAEAAWIEHSGYFERTFPVNPFGDAAAYHTVSLVFESGLVDIESIVLDSQSTAYKWAAALPHQFLIQN
jgi:ADP-ribose pyrophosphatase YjhB (NUDIX family)